MSTSPSSSALKKGYLLLLALVFGAIFVTVFGALAGFVLSQNKMQEQQSKAAYARTLAESGIEYYRWFLSHFPGDAQHGTGSAGPYVLSQTDSTGAPVGSVSLALAKTLSCGETTSITVSATGTATGTPPVSRTISARYAQPTVALYGEIVNDNTWIRAERALSGLFHSNGGVRMDGTTNAPLSSSLSSWNCTSLYGCTPVNATAPGVLGNGTPTSLWSEEAVSIDFEGIRGSFGSIKTAAQSAGIYYPRISTGTATSSANYWNGYHLLFNSNGTVTVRRVTQTEELSVTPLVVADGTKDFSRIQTESTFETRTLSANCGLIFVEDNVWIEGTIPGKVTVVAASVESAGLIEPTIYIKDSIQQATGNGTSGLTAIAARNILIAADAPTNLYVQGIFVAAQGAFGRNLYMSGGSCNGTYEPRSSFTFSGTIVSNKESRTKWNGGCDGGDGGYLSRTDSYDRTLATNPPVFTPTISSDYRLFDWSE